jgi:multidrug transporter EmrE-like cation transporter
MLKDKILALALISIGLVFELVGDFMLKKWANTSELRNLIYGISLYFIGIIPFVASFKFEILSKVVLVYCLIGLIGGVLIGVIVFHERLSMVNMVGLVLAFIALILVEA